MRFFLALTVTVLGDALAWLAVLAAFAASVWWLITMGMPIALAVLAAAGFIIAAVWLIADRLKLDRLWRDAVFSLAGYGPAPSRPGHDNPKMRALACAAIVTPVVTLILVTPLAILLAPLIGQSFAIAAWMVILIEVFIGAPILFGVAYASYDRACAEFGAERFPPPGDSRLDEKIRRRMVDDIKGK